MSYRFEYLGPPESEFGKEVVVDEKSPTEFYRYGYAEAFVDEIPAAEPPPTYDDPNVKPIGWQGGGPMPPILVDPPILANPVPGPGDGEVFNEFGSEPYTMRTAALDQAITEQSAARVSASSGAGPSLATIALVGLAGWFLFGGKKRTKR